MKKNHPHSSIYFSALLIAGVLTTFSVPAASDALDLLENDIQSWRLEDARDRLEKLTAETAILPRALFLKGKLLFFEGELEAALDALRKAVAENRSEMSWKALRDRAAETKRVFDSLSRTTGESKKFVYRLDTDTDGLLVSYAEEALNRQLRALSDTFGDVPKRPIEIVVVSDSASLSAVSGLSKDQIERTGTVGVTKYSRIMIVSPSNLVSGYPWLDTLAHELTHYVVTRASRDRIPIWLHEGIAKLLECRYLRNGVQDLSPEEAYLLDRAVKEGRLIPLRRFHPSIAYLPDQEEAALAYAQTLSFLRYLNERMPKDWLKRLASGLARGTPLDGMLKSLGGANLQRFYGWWKTAVAGKWHTPVPAVAMLKKRFKRGTMASHDTGDSLHALEVRKHLRLGDLLRLRGHGKAAVVQFEKAREIAKFPSPEISDRLGASLLELGEYKRARDLLVSITALYPSHAAGFVQSARAYVGLSETQKAVDALVTANALNPFDPEVHCALSGLFREIGNSEGFAVENENCRAAVAVQKQTAED